MDPTYLDGGGELHAVVAPGSLERLRSTFRRRVIRVDEVEVRARGDAVEEAHVPSVLHAIPAHVRDLPTGRQPAHGARHDVEPAALAEFLARREQQLVPEADPEKRPAAVERAPERPREPEAIEVRHRVVERAVAGQHDGVRLVDAARILGDRRGHADPPERLLDRAEIPAPVIDQGNHRLASPSAAARTAAITTYPSSRAGCR